MPSSRLLLAITPQNHEKPTTYSVFRVHRALIIGCSVVVLALLILLLGLLLIWYRRRKMKTSPYDLTAIRLQRFTFRDLKLATRSFSSANRLGKGGFGVVYKGALRNGKEVAIKRMDSASTQGEREFQNELSIIGGLRNPYIVTLLGYCIDGKKRLLVYERMHNRSLQEALFESEVVGCVLDWDKRYKIILDIAQALAFLHLECDPPIVHSDIKPSNVLLDGHFGAKLADFGLSRVKTEGDYAIELSQDLGRSYKSQDLTNLTKSQDLSRSQDFTKGLFGACKSDLGDVPRYDLLDTRLDLIDSKCNLDSSKCDLVDSKLNLENGLLDRKCSLENGLLDSKCNWENKKCGFVDSNLENSKDGLLDIKCNLEGSKYDLFDYKRDSEKGKCGLLDIRCNLENNKCDFLDGNSHLEDNEYGLRDSKCELLDSNGDLENNKCDLLQRKSDLDDSKFGLKDNKCDFGKDNDDGRNVKLIGVEECEEESETEVDFAMALQQHNQYQNQQVDFAMALQKHNQYQNQQPQHAVFGNYFAEEDKGKEIVENSGDLWTDESKEMRFSPAATSPKQPWGKDWWWRQDGSGELCAKDYVMEWIGSQIKPFDESSNIKDGEKEEPPKSPKVEELSESWESKCKMPVQQRDKNSKRKCKEWWKEEYFAELNKKSKKLRKLEGKWKRGKRADAWLTSKLCCCVWNPTRKCNARSQSHGVGQSPNFSSRGRRKKHRSTGSDIWSGDLLSRDMSSTTSMRGTVCYIAPEYGGCGYLSEKGDIYSFGVLMLVIISGRRPLHILASPMKDFEKANLISWARHLAQTGNILELVDESLRGVYNRDQATLCITLALLCLQRIPELRPDINEIVKVLKGEMDAPGLPFEFSPSPPCKVYSRSRRKSNPDCCISVDFP